MIARHTRTEARMLPEERLKSFDEASGRLHEFFVRWERHGGVDSGKSEEVMFS